MLPHCTYGFRHLDVAVRYSPRTHPTVWQTTCLTFSKLGPFGMMPEVQKLLVVGIIGIRSPITPTQSRKTITQVCIPNNARAQVLTCGAQATYGASKTSLVSAGSAWSRQNTHSLCNSGWQKADFHLTGRLTRRKCCTSCAAWDQYVK